MTSPASNRTRLSASERRASIVDAAMNLFSKNGFRATTTRELAAACGVSEPVLYQHFATKRALYDAIVETHAQQDQGECQFRETLAGASAAGNNQEFFNILGTALLDWYTADPRFSRLLMFSALEGHELADLFYRAKVVAFYDLITAHIQRQIETGRFKRVDPLLAARIFAGTISHQGIVFAIYCPGHLPAPKAEIVQNAVAIFLKGISQE
jgi:AcrR family transcriptional regulator